MLYLAKLFFCLFLCLKIEAACGDDKQQIQAHRIILSAASPLFEEMLEHHKHPNPLIYMWGIKTKDLISIVDFIYHGEVKINPEDANDFLSVAEVLQLKGLSRKTDEDEEAREKMWAGMEFFFELFRIF